MERRNLMDKKELGVEGACNAFFYSAVQCSAEFFDSCWSLSGRVSQGGVRQTGGST